MSEVKEEVKCGNCNHRPCPFIHPDGCPVTAPHCEVFVCDCHESHCEFPAVTSDIPDQEQDQEQSVNAAIKPTLASSDNATHLTAHEWLDIETAPKDGTWQVVARLNLDNITPIWWERAKWIAKRVQWSSSGGVCEPTHYLPLPSQLRRLHSGEKRLLQLLTQILWALPKNRDWLDPQLEQEASELTGVHRPPTRWMPLPSPPTTQDTSTASGTYQTSPDLGSIRPSHDSESPSPQQGEGVAERKQLLEIWHRHLDNFRELGADEWRDQYHADIEYLFSALNERDRLIDDCADAREYIDELRREQEKSDSVSASLRQTCNGLREQIEAMKKIQGDEDNPSSSVSG